jgi:ribokinase
MMDLTAYAEVLPEPGQTLAGQLFTTGFGGKGANQAVMAAHCGAQVHFIGKLGDDVFGKAIADNFVKVGINSEYVETSSTPNGVAHIWVDGNGEIQDLAIVVAQCEIKQEVTLAAFKAAKARGATTILNPAPYQQLSAELLQLTDWLIPNETEFRELHGSLPTNDEVLKSFRPGKNTIVTLGSEGAVYISPKAELHRVSAPKVTAIDTTGAGDAFVGSFAFALASGKDPIDAMKFGVSIASLSVTRKGAQSSYPNQAEIATLS